MRAVTRQSKTERGTLTEDEEEEDFLRALDENDKVQRPRRGGYQRLCDRVALQCSVQTI